MLTRHLHHYSLGSTYRKVETQLETATPGSHNSPLMSTLGVCEISLLFHEKSRKKVNEAKRYRQYDIKNIGSSYLLCCETDEALGEDDLEDADEEEEEDEDEDEDVDVDMWLWYLRLYVMKGRCQKYFQQFKFMKH